MIYKVISERKANMSREFQGLQGVRGHGSHTSLKGAYILPGCLESQTVQIMLELTMNRCGGKAFRWNRLFLLLNKILSNVNVYIFL